MKLEPLAMRLYAAMNEHTEQRGAAPGPPWDELEPELRGMLVYAVEAIFAELSAAVRTDLRYDRVRDALDEMADALAAARADLAGK